MPGAVNILSVDGGGVRGIIPAILLEALEQRLGAPLYQHFDLIAGTSTGALIAMGLACPLNSGRPLTPAELLSFYLDNAATIFPHHWWNRLRKLFWPEYSAGGLERVLRQAFGEVRLSQALKPLLIASYDLSRQQPYFFKSESARRGSGGSGDWPLVSVARATSAAPTYLPAFRTRGPDGANYVFADGGLYANNPVVAAYAEAARLHPDVEVIRIVSLGTGNTAYPLPANAAVHWGQLAWAERIAPVMMDGTSEAYDYEARWLCTRRRDHFWRLQPELPPAASPMDASTPAALALLCSIARAYAAAQASQLDEIAAVVKT